MAGKNSNKKSSNQATSEPLTSKPLKKGALKGPNTQERVVVDDVRNLVHEYHVCGWRSRSQEILRTIGKHHHSRSLEFLFKIAAQADDVPMAATAIESLSEFQKTDRAALIARFLVGLYPTSKAVIKDTILKTLFHFQNVSIRSSVHQWLMDEKDEHRLDSLIVLAGESRSFASLNEIGKHVKNPKLLASVILSLGKLATREQFRNFSVEIGQQDLFIQQLMVQIDSQVMFRSRWTIEDYLNMIHSPQSSSRDLDIAALELARFHSNEIIEAFDLLVQDEKMHKNLFFLLSRVEYTLAQEWIKSRLPYAEWNELHLSYYFSQATCLLESGFEDVHRELYHAHREKFVNNESLFTHFCQSSRFLQHLPLDFFRTLLSDLPNEQLRQTTVNHLLEHLESCSESNPQHREQVGFFFEHFSQYFGSADFIDSTVLPRFFRGIGRYLLIYPTAINIGQLKHTFDAAKSLTSESRHFSSICVLNESISHRGLFETLEASYFEHFQTDPMKTVSFLRCAITQDHLKQRVEKNGRWVTLLRNSLLMNTDAAVKAEAIRFLTKHPVSVVETELYQCLQSGNSTVQVLSIIALKALRGPKPTSQDELVDATRFTEAMCGFLKSENPVLRGRALDALITVPTTQAARSMVEALELRADDTIYVEKFLRAFWTEKRTPATLDKKVKTDLTQILESIMDKYPEHPFLEGFVEMHERIRNFTNSVKSNSKNEWLKEVESDLVHELGSLSDWSQEIRSALFSAELIVKRPEIFSDEVDKSAAILEYCKAIDLFLEERFGKVHLFARLDRDISQFQNRLLEMNVDRQFRVSNEFLLKYGFDKHFTLQSFPSHKASQIAHSILDEKILIDRYRVVDGLRAWAVFLILFATPDRGSQRKPTIPLGTTSGDTSTKRDSLLHLCKKLMELQDVRNPAAHRQTLLKFFGLDDFRKEVLGVLKELSSWI